MPCIGPPGAGCCGGGPLTCEFIGGAPWYGLCGDWGGTGLCVGGPIGLGACGGGMGLLWGEGLAIIL